MGPAHQSVWRHSTSGDALIYRGAMSTQSNMSKHLRVDPRPQRELDPCELIAPKTQTAKRRVGLLALQGDFDMHRKTVRSLGYDTTEVRTPAELETVDCLIMPGGESTTMRKLMMHGGLWDAIREFGQRKPIMGTCAGLILLGKGITERPGEPTLGLLDVDTSRNAYGRQYHSFRDNGTISLNGTEEPFEMVFIRAPKITRIGQDVEILGRYREDVSVVRQGKIMGLTFHPELADDNRLHKMFLDMVQRSSKSST
ncbi:MAG: hypothetical protein Kow0074_21950 [Candidatus Zixiibacteriota bacterium]